MITATCGRPAFLASCLSQFQRQVYSGFRCEHIVVSDGIDPVAKFLADHWRARYFELESPGGAAGAYAKDVGIRVASGDYVCFWDDDNIYEPHALATLYAVANGGDMGVVRVRHRLRTRPGLVTIPRR